MDITNIHGFVLFAVVLAATPGIDMMLVIKHAMASGWRSGMATTLGVTTGSLVWTIAAAVGLVTVIDGIAAVTGAPVFDGLLGAGILYMGWIGVMDLRAGLRGNGLDEWQQAPKSVAAWRAMRDGFGVNMLNPKVGLFYLTVVPQFVGDGPSVLAQFIALGMIHVGIGTCILTVCALAAGRLHHLLAGGRPRRVMLVTSGVMILVFAAALATQRLTG